MAKAKQKIIQDGIEYASKEEMWFASYVQELLDKDYLLSATYQPSAFELSTDRCVTSRVIKKNTCNAIGVSLTKKHSYTPDWVLCWAEKANGVFFWTKGREYQNGFFPFRKTLANNFVPFYATEKTNISVVDIKGGFVGRNNSSGVTFSLNQKWVLDKYDIFIQKVVVSLDQKGLFFRTFTPNRVVTDEVYKIKSREGEPKLKYDPRTLEDFINKKK